MARQVTSGAYPLNDPERSGPETMTCRMPDPPWSFDAWSERWFPDRYRYQAGPRKGQYTDEAAWAISRCRGCPFVVTCGMAAIDMERNAKVANRHGVFGAMDPKDRYDRLVEMNGGKPPTSRGYAVPTEDAEPLRRLLVDAKERAGTGASVDTRIADAVGIGSDTVRMIRTGKRTRVRATTYTAIMSYFEKGGQ
jgi:hypothetical protein